MGEGLQKGELWGLESICTPKAVELRVEIQFREKRLDSLAAGSSL